MAKKSNKVVNAGIGYTIGNIFIKGVSFLTIPLYTRLMATGDYGIYNTYVAYVGIVTFFVCLGMDPTLKNAEQDFPERRDKLLYSRFGIPGLWPILVFVLMVVLKVIVARFPQKFG